ncbi:MAG: FecCD family ABC transporter permease [Microbacterium sp.]
MISVDSSTVDRRLHLVVRTRGRRRLLGLLGLLAIVVIGVILSIALGARSISVDVIIDVLTGARAGNDYESLVIVSERVPRAVLALLVGASLGCSGVIMQALTRNPLADPGVLGIELGAAFAVLLGILFFGVRGASSYFWWALAGSAVTACVVLVIARLASLAASSTISLVIAGAALSAILGSLITLLIVRDTAVYAHYNYWSVGQLNGRGGVIEEIWVFVIVGLALALPLGGPLNALALGDEVAEGLGVAVGRWQLYGALVAVVLCAAATAAVGPVAFVGLLGAHTARLLVGNDHRWLMPYGALCGASLILLADVACRLVPGNGELQVAIATAVIGAPVFVLLARRRTVVPA